MKLSGSEILLQCLRAEGTKKIFGYPGGQIISVFDAMYDYRNVFDNILVRHEQGAIHAAQGYARVSGEVGVVVVTSGPGATNVITGIADANIDSTPLVVITGQVASAQLGSDAFQETDMLCITLPITKWSYQIRRAEDISWAVARAFYIARTGRPGPVVLDFAKNAQVDEIEWDEHRPCNYIRSYQPVPALDTSLLWEAVQLINAARRPLLVCGQGVMLGHAEEELKAFVRKTGIPVATTLLGLSALPTGFPNYIGMVGMHGNVVPNKMTQQCDVLIAIGCRFADRVTGVASNYAPHAQIIHIDIDPAEIGKNVKVALGICGDAKEVLTKILPHLKENNHDSWIHSFDFYKDEELKKVVGPEIHPEDGSPIKMGEVVNTVTEISSGDAIIVTDVGQNQMFAARYSHYARPRSFISSGGLGTMGFGLPAAIGAKMAAPDREVVFFVGDGGIQMTIEELGTIMQERTAVKIVVLDNTWLGMVRQWQELFFRKRYSQTHMMNPDFVKVAEAYDIQARRVTIREELETAVREMLECDGPYLLHVAVQEESMVFPMVPGGQPVDHILLSRNEKI